MTKPKRKPYPKTGKGGETKAVHRAVWEQAYGTIPPGYVIHHRDHDPTNNALENLELMSHEAHSRHHNDKHPRVKECEVCGTKFEPSATKRARARTCSRDCKLELQRRLARERAGGVYEVVCASCGRRKRVSRGRAATAKFCSRECSNRRPKS